MVTEMMERRGISAAGAGGFVTIRLIALSLASFVIPPHANRVDKRMLVVAATANTLAKPLQACRMFVLALLNRRR